MARHYPKWATPDRQTYLVKLFLKSRGFCVFGHKNCLIPDHHYEVYSECLIDDWKADDRAETLADWLDERQQLHRTADRHYPPTGQFSGVSRDIFFDHQPVYYVVCYGISGLTFKPFVKVRVSSSYVNLYIDLADSFKGLSKSKRRKAIRYGKALPSNTREGIEQLIRLAVRHYQSQS